MIRDMTSADSTLHAWHTLLRGRLRRGERVVLPVLSGSMMPLMPIGAVLEIAGSAWHDLRPGDVAVFRDGKSLTAHRVLLSLPLPGRPLLYQKGDALPRGAWIDARRVVGAVVAVTPPDGTRLALDDPTARGAAGRLARRYLRWDLRHRLLRRRQPFAPARPTAAIPAAPRQGTLVTLGAVPTPREGCRPRELAGETALISPDGSAYHVLDDPGAFIWRALDGRRSLADIATLLCGEYEVSPGTAAADLMRFVDQLSAAGLIDLSWPGDPDGAPAA
jgi:hypothetical protein